MNTSAKRIELTATSFNALSDTEKKRIYQEIDGMTIEQLRAADKPLTASQRKRWATAQKRIRAGRPKFGKHGTRIVSVTVEKGLLKQVDALAKAKGMKRSELVAMSLREKIANVVNRDRL